MTDLIKRLRDPSTSSEASTARQEAADHIEQTEAKLTKAVEFLKTMADYNIYVIAPFLAELKAKE
jgi:hypothetical protein